MNSTDSITIVDPGVEEPQASAQAMAPRLVSLAGTTIGVIDNSKHMAAPLLSAVEELLKSRYGVGVTVRYRKDNPSIPTPAESVAQLVGDCDAVIHGVAD